MTSGSSPHWIDRLSAALREHESARISKPEGVPRYEVLAEIRRGGMGVIYRAWDPRLGREVALKVLLEHAASTPDARERFLREAQLAARLQHPHIVPIFDTGTWQDQVYLAMQFIDGSTVDQAGLDLKGKLAAVRDAARALDYAHTHGVVHRDVKPTNLLVDRKGHVFVTDFGIARPTDAGVRLTLTGTVLGTPAYMAPEQAKGLDADARSDVYALGATLYELTVGRPPFEGFDPARVLHRVVHEEPVPPRRLDLAIPRDVENIILKSMEKEPAHRYASAAALAEDLQRVLDLQPIQASRSWILHRFRRRLERNRWAPIALVAAAAAAILAVSLLSVARRSPERDLELLGLKILEADLAGARRIVDEMERIDAGSPHTEKGRRLLASADRARAEADALERAARSAVAEGAWLAAREKTLALREQIIPELRDAAGRPMGFRDLQPRAGRLTAELVDRLSAAAALLFDPPHPQPLWTMASHLLQVNPEAFDRLVTNRPALVGRWVAARRGDVATDRVVEHLAVMEREAPESPWTADAAAACLDRLRADPTVAIPGGAAALARRLAADAFRRRSLLALDLAVSLSAGSAAAEDGGTTARQIGELGAARLWFQDYREAKRILAINIESARRARAALDGHGFSTDLRETAAELLAALDHDLEREGDRIKAQRLSIEGKSACARDDLKTARVILDQLRKIPQAHCDAGLLNGLASDILQIEKRHADKILRIGEDACAQRRLTDAQEALKQLQTLSPESVPTDRRKRLGDEIFHLEQEITRNAEDAFRRMETACDRRDLAAAWSSLDGLQALRPNYRLGDRWDPLVAKALRLENDLIVNAEKTLDEIDALVRADKVKEARARLDAVKPNVPMPHGGESARVAHQGQPIDAARRIDALQNRVTSLDGDLRALDALAGLREAAEHGDATAFDDRRRKLLPISPGMQGRLDGVFDAALAQGRSQLSRGDAAAAESWFSEAALLAPTRWQPRVLRGESRHKRGESAGARADWTAARGCLDRLLANDPNQPSLLLERARVARRLGDLDSALQDAELSRRLRDTADAALFAGQVCFVQSSAPGCADVPTRLKRAAQAFADAARFDPDKPIPAYWLGVAFYQLGDRKAALEALARAQSGGLADAALRYAKLLLLDQRPDACEKSIRAATDAIQRAGAGLTEDELRANGWEAESLSPSVAAGRVRRDAFLIRATALYEKDAPDWGLADCRRALELDTGSAPAHFQCAKALCKHDRHDEARGHYASAHRSTSSTIREEVKKRMTLCEEGRCKK
jgi:tetratricopeptide (TPR) repeat protein